MIFNYWYPYFITVGALACMIQLLKLILIVTSYGFRNIPQNSPVFTNHDALIISHFINSESYDFVMNLSIQYNRVSTCAHTCRNLMI